MNNILSLVKKESENDISEKCFEQMKGRKFVAISFDDDGNSNIHYNRISSEQIIYGCQLLIAKEAKACLND